MKKSNVKNVSYIAAEYLCHSCGACFVVCKHSSISYHETVGGYLFPQINTETCTNCGLCYDVCPGHHFGTTLKEHIPQDPFVGKIISCMVGRARDDVIFMNAQSGGVATALLVYLFESKQIETAIVAEMQTSIPPRGKVIIVNSPAELTRAQKSKYTPIPLLTAIKSIKNEKGGVAIVGLPCHFHGLYNLFDIYPALKKIKFFKIGLICDRVMTTTAIDFMINKATNQPVNNFVFRDKTQPSYPGNPVVKKEDGSSTILKASLRMMIKDFFTPVRCRLCFDKLNVFADVVLGDPHGVPDIDRVCGESLIFSRTVKGKLLVDEAEKHMAIKLKSLNVKLIIEGQAINRKREDWAAYMQTWEGLGRKCPDYGIALPQQAICRRKYRDQMISAMLLDQFSSRTELFRAVWLKLVKRKIKNAVIWRVEKFKLIIRRMKQCILR